MNLPLESIENILNSLSSANQDFRLCYPGESGERQPVHSLYGGAHLFKRNAASKMGSLALQSLALYAPDFIAFARALNLSGSEKFGEKEDAAFWEKKIKENPQNVQKENPDIWRLFTIYDRVVEKLKREPVEDLRIDFEDGYGIRADDEEDRHAVQAAEEVACGMAEKTLPPFLGIRIKSMSEECKKRAVRTLDIFLGTLLEKAHDTLPPHFAITIPKVTIPRHVSAIAELLDIMESGRKLPGNSIKIEIMIETPQSLIDKNGQCPLSSFIEAAQGRCTSVHLGIYDFTASCDITARYQQMSHPLCDFVRFWVKVALASRGVYLVDSPTTLMPVGIHKASDAVPLTGERHEENIRIVYQAWKVCYDNIRHSLKNGYYQGWDLHPAQIPVRYAAIYSFFFEEMETMSHRFKGFLAKAGQANRIGMVFDDAATGQGILNFFLRAVRCGAISEEEMKTLTGITTAELNTRSFSWIRENMNSR